MSVGRLGALPHSRILAMTLLCMSDGTINIRITLLLFTCNLNLLASTYYQQHTSFQKVRSQAILLSQNFYFQCRPNGYLKL